MDNLTPYHPKIMSKTRTAGDGMESDKITIETIRKVSIKPTTRAGCKETVPPSRLIQVYATNVTKTEKKTHIHSKSPKFVPYEPYAAATKPIVPHTVSKSKKSKNNMDINTLISQMSQMNTKLNEYKPRPKLTSTGENPAIDNDKLNPETVEMQKTIDKLLQDNETLKDQLKQQVQVIKGPALGGGTSNEQEANDGHLILILQKIRVNKELKTMLVASMGEDLETQVQSLNDDKKHLATALLNSAQHLSTHQEQTEWLAGQCEVWRSKFLASSLMVEELANWKKVLNEKTVNLQQAIKQLLDERCRTRDMMLCTYKNLYSLHEKWLENIAISEYVGNTKVYNQPIGNLNLNTSMPHSSNIMDLALVNLKLSENVSSSYDKPDISYLKSLPADTEGEKNAENIMAMPLEVKKVSEEPVNALVHHAYTSSGITPRPIASCVHCNGKVQLL